MSDREYKYPDMWVPRPRKANYPSYMEIDPKNPGTVIPIPEICFLLEDALDSLNNGQSLRAVADWLNEKLIPWNVTYSHAGLRKIWGNKRTIPVVPIKKPKRSLVELKEVRRKKKIADEKRRLNYVNKRIEKLTTEIKEIKKEEEDRKPLVGVLEVEALPERDDTNERQIIFSPNPGPQTSFLSAWEQEVLYGGAAGGGKSYAMLADPIRYFSNGNFRGLLVRRTNDELKELKWKSIGLYNNPELKGVWREKDSIWRFPSGAEFWFTYLERDEDVLRYQGQSFTWIGIDELTQYATPFAWNYLRSRLRSTDINLPLSMRATSNPGGPGHGWVKRMFIDPAPYNTTFNARDLDTNEELRYPETYPSNHRQAGQPHPRAGQPLFQRRFIPASLYDNPYLMQDPNYEANLLSMPEDQRRQLLEGDWNVADGAAFREFNQSIHVVKPHKIEYNWRKFRSCDYGYGSHSAVHWYAIDNEGTLIVYRELYVSKKTGKELAELILEAEQDENISYGVLDSSVWAERGTSGPTVAEEMIGAGCRWRPADRSKGSRSAGKNRLHELLKVNEATGRPGIVFFDTCRQIITDLPVIPTDPDGEDDIDDRYTSDHAYDSIRYGIMSRPRGHSFWDMPYKQVSTYIPSDRGFGY